MYLQSQTDLTLVQSSGEIERYNPRDARKYAEFIDFWQRVISMMIPVFNAPPKSVVDIAGNFDIAQLKDLFSLAGPADKTLDLMRTLFSSPWDLLEEGSSRGCAGCQWQRVPG